MNVTMMQTVSIAAFLLAGFFAIVAGIFWFWLNIREAMEDLSGKRVKRQVLKLHKQSGKSDDSTAILQDEYRLILNEIVIHTKERI